MANVRRIGVLAIVLTVAGAAAPAAVSAHEKPISKADAGRQYLALVAPVNAALATFVSKAHGWTASTSDAHAERDAGPAIAALKHLNSKLISDRWPSGAQSDVKALVRSDAPLIGDLQSLSTISLLNASSWLSTFDRDVSGLGAAVGIVRHDLGLPAARGS